jgi:hypothetical protein
MTGFAGLLNRRVDVEHVDPDAEDEHGNRTRITTGWSYAVRARRELVSAEERATFGAFTAVIYRYYLEPTTRPITDRDRVHDGPDVFEVRGGTDAVEGRRAVHHVEAVVEKVRG